MGVERPGRALRVLLVEDERDDYLRTRDLLGGVAGARYVLDWASTLEAAESRLENLAYDACLLAYQVGGRTSLELLARVRDLPTPVILLTGRDDASIDRDVLTAGAVDYLVKANLDARELDRALRYAVERARILDSARRSERSVRQLIDALPAGIAVMRDGRVVWANRALAEMLGVVADERAPTRDAAIAALVVDADAAAAREPGPIERRILRGDGTTRVLQVSRIALFFEEMPGQVVVVHDVTGRREIEARLTLADRMSSVGTLAAGVAHEINNPLAVVIANLALLGEMPETATPQARDALVEARAGAERVRRIVRDLKAFAHGDSNRRVEVDAVAVLESALNVAHNELRHRARVDRQLAAVPPVMASEAQLAQVFLNLLLNAADALPENRVEANFIRAVARTDGDRVVVEIVDNGRGIAPENLEHVFDPFFTTKGVGYGTGLGLSVCHGVVKSFGGTIAVESERGKGTTFRVSLPAHVAPARPAPRPAPAGGDRARRRLLVVDDEPIVCATVRRVLMRDHDVVTTTSPNDALARIEAGERYDLIVCDLMMPEMSGMQLHEAIAAVDAQAAARMVFLTGGAFTPLAQAFLVAPGRLRIDKPFDAAELRARVAELLELLDGQR